MLIIKKDIIFSQWLININMYLFLRKKKLFY